LGVHEDISSIHTREGDMMKFLCKHSKLKPRPAVVFLTGKRFTLVIVCFFSYLIFQVPAGANLKGLYVGAKAPDFFLEDFNGQSSSFADLSGGKLTMVIFWATWNRNSDNALIMYHKIHLNIIKSFCSYPGGMT
jgi:hypothetical protein